MPRMCASGWQARASTHRRWSSFARFLQMRLQGRELAHPQLLRLLEPGFELIHGFLPQSVNAHARVELVPRFLDEAAFAQRTQVPAHRRKGEARRFGELARAARAFAQEIHDAPA